MDTLEYFVNKYHLDLSQKPHIPIEKINRLMMAKDLAALGFTKGAEVGVADGDHSELLLKTIPDLTMACIDPWLHIDGYRSFRRSTLENWRLLAVERLSKFDKCTIIRKTSMEAVLEFADQSLDFVYLDGRHDFRYIAEDICEWLPKVRAGGILFGHDYTCIPFGAYACHVKQVVDAYAESHNIDLWFSLGMLGKPDGRYRQGELSWMYIL